MRKLTWTKSKGYRHQSVLTTLRLRVESGLIGPHPMVEAEKYFPPTQLHYKGEIKQMEFKEDRIREEYHETFPEPENERPLKIFPGITKWYEDAADVWVKKQADLMKENDLTFQQGWDIMMYNYRKELHLERLEKQYQLQQLQESGVQMIPELPHSFQETSSRYSQVHELIERDEESQFFDYIWSVCRVKLEAAVHIAERVAFDAAVPIAHVESRYEPEELDDEIEELTDYDYLGADSEYLDSIKPEEIDKEDVDADDYIDPIILENELSYEDKLSTLLLIYNDADGIDFNMDDKVSKIAAVVDGIPIKNTEEHERRKEILGEMIGKLKFRMQLQKEFDEGDEMEDVSTSEARVDKINALNQEIVQLENLLDESRAGYQDLLEDDFDSYLHRVDAAITMGDPDYNPFDEKNADTRDEFMKMNMPTYDALELERMYRQKLENSETGEGMNEDEEEEIDELEEVRLIEEELDDELAEDDAKETAEHKGKEAEEEGEEIESELAEAEEEEEEDNEYEYPMDPDVLLEVQEDELEDLENEDDDENAEYEDGEGGDLDNMDIANRTQNEAEFDDTFNEENIDKLGADEDEIEAESEDAPVMLEYVNIPEHYTDDPTFSEETFPYPITMKVRFSDFSPTFPQLRVLQFMQKFPNLAFIFHDEWQYDSLYLNSVFPFTPEQDAQFEAIRSRVIVEEIDDITRMRNLLTEEEKIRDQLKVVNHPLPYTSFLEENPIKDFPISPKQVAGLFNELGFPDMSREAEIEENERQKATDDLKALLKDFDERIARQ